MISAANNVNSAAFAELKQQMALRVAEQAEREAEQLKSQANEKRKEARDMAKTAQELELGSGQAQNRADAARASVGPNEFINALGNQLDAIASSLTPEATSTVNQDDIVQQEQTGSDPVASGQSVNMLGQATGSLINITV